MALKQIRRTQTDGLARVVRISLGVLFAMTGAMKLLVPMLAEAWAGQLAVAEIPFQELNRVVVPFVEIGVGVVLLVGFYARLAAMVVLGIMVVATYVHLVVDAPSLFPLQPSQPVIPLIVMLLAVYTLMKGGGSGSLDLKANDTGS